MKWGREERPVDNEWLVEVVGGGQVITHLLAWFTTRCSLCVYKYVWFARHSVKSQNDSK